MKYSLFFLISVSLIGCNQNRIKSLEDELQVEREKNLVLQKQIEQYESKISNFTNKQIIQMVEDFIDFRCPEYSIKDSRVMQISDYEYDISTLYKHSTFLCCLNWSRTIIKIKVKTDGTYSVVSDSFPC